MTPGRPAHGGSSTAKRRATFLHSFSLSSGAFCPALFISCLIESRQSFGLPRKGRGSASVSSMSRRMAANQSAAAPCRVALSPNFMNVCRLARTAARMLTPPTHHLYPGSSAQSPKMAVPTMLDTMTTGMPS